MKATNPGKPAIIMTSSSDEASPDIDRKAFRKDVFSILSKIASEYRNQGGSLNLPTFFKSVLSSRLAEMIEDKYLKAKNV